jgi:hypothetical protein
MLRALAAPDTVAVGGRFYVGVAPLQSISDQQDEFQQNAGVPGLFASRHPFATPRGDLT